MAQEKSKDEEVDPSKWSKLALAAKNPQNAQTNRVDNLLALGKRIVLNKDFQPKNGATFCNMAVAMAAEQFGYDGFYTASGSVILANAMIVLMAKSSKAGTHWKKVSASEAYELVLDGKLVIAAYSDTPHGHVAVVAPVARVWSGKWSSYVPAVFNVGKNMNLQAPYTMGENFAFVYRPEHYALIA